VWTGYSDLFPRFYTSKRYGNFEPSCIDVPRTPIGIRTLCTPWRRYGWVYCPQNLFDGLLAGGDFGGGGDFGSPDDDAGAISDDASAPGESDDALADGDDSGL
jgi:hypothetical protein